jgi:hypothetical protein
MNEVVSPEMKIDVPLSFRVSTEERLEIINAARIKNISVSNYLRQAALSFAYVQPPNEAIKIDANSQESIADDPETINKERSYITIKCSEKQHELLKEIFHPTVFSEANILPEGYEELAFEDNLLLGLFILSELKKVVVNKNGRVCEEPFINIEYDFSEYYPLLKLDRTETGSMFFETISDIKTSEDVRVSNIISKHNELIENLYQAVKLVKNILSH